MSKVSALGHLGVAMETTYGTAVPPVYYVPYNTIKVEDDIKKILDDGKRGILTKDFNSYDGAKSGTVEIDSMAYPDVLGFFLKAIFGQDTVTGSASPYSHKFTVANTLCPSVTIQDYNTVTERQYAGGLVSELGFKFDSSKEVSMSAKMISKASVTATQTTPTILTTDPFLGYTATLKIGGTPNLNLISGEVTVKREAQLIFSANNTQQPTKYVTARCEAEGKLVLDIEDETEFLLYLNNTKPTLDILFTQNANTSLELSFGRIDVTKAVLDRSQETVRCDLSFKALYNATDNGMATFTLKNSVASY
jgi:hypothetical protein